MPICPKCGKSLKAQSQMSIFDAIEVSINDALRSVACMPPAPIKYFCTHNTINPKMTEWQQESQKIKMQNKKIESQNKKRKLMRMAPKPLIPVPPKPPLLIPCEWNCHYVRTGKFYEDKKKRKRRKYLLCDQILNRVYEPKSILNELFKF